jgi:hypothetical protein
VAPLTRPATAVRREKTGKKNTKKVCNIALEDIVLGQREARPYSLNKLLAITAQFNVLYVVDESRF